VQKLGKNQKKRGVCIAISCSKATGHQTELKVKRLVPFSHFPRFPRFPTDPHPNLNGQQQEMDVAQPGTRTRVI